MIFQKYAVFKVLFCCLMFVVLLSACRREDPQEHQTDRIIRKVNRSFSGSDLVINGNGGFFNGGVNKFSFSYIVYAEKMDEQIARKYLIDTVEKVLAEINIDKGIRPFLISYPFTEENLLINISFMNGNGQRLQPPNLAKISEWEGKVYYAEYPNGVLTDVKIEDYSEEYNKLYGVNPPNRAVLD